jgi:hypothetical protein
MLCFRDMTFCGSDCANTECRRHFGEEEKDAAHIWWGSDGAPVAFSDFSDTCPGYRKPEHKA